MPKSKGKELKKSRENKVTERKKSNTELKKSYQNLSLS